MILEPTVRKRFIRFSYLVPLAFLAGFLGAASPLPAVEDNPDNSAGGMGVQPSERDQVQPALDFLQALLNQGAQQAPAQPDDMQPDPNSFLGDLDFYLQDNAGAWFVMLTKLALAAFLGLILALVYRATYTGKRKKYNPSLVQSQLLLSIGGAMIWIVVATSLVRAFGLAGMVGLIRYRTPVRDPKDNVMVFLSMGVGMACGLGQATAAIVSTGFLTLVLFGIQEFGLGKKKKKKQKPAPEGSPSLPTEPEENPPLPTEPK